MQNLLFLCHRLPWPPNKGDKIRSYHVLRRLAEHYRVYLGAFVDNPEDLQYLQAVKALCSDTCVRPLGRIRAGLRACASLARAEPLTLAYYRDAVMHRWVEGLVTKGKVDLALCYSSGVAPYLLHHKMLRRIMDFVDVDSDKWRQYAENRRGLTGLIYRREARQLEEFERRVATDFDASLFVSEAEAGFFRARAPMLAGKVHGIPNGVDTDYWDPGRDYPDPYPPEARVVVFTGAMDYWANADAARWFAAKVWPRVRAECPQAHLYIVGSNPSASVRALNARDGVSVTGRVADVRPYLAHAHVAAAPLRIARGIQNKVLEALAMEKVLLATPEAYEGIEDFDGRQGAISGSPEALAAAALRALGSAQPVRVAAARAEVLKRYQWPLLLDEYERALGDVQPSAVSVQARAGRTSLEACS